MIPNMHIYSKTRFLGRKPYFQKKYRKTSKNPVFRGTPTKCSVLGSLGLITVISTMNELHFAGHKLGKKKPWFTSQSIDKSTQHLKGFAGSIEPLCLRWIPGYHLEPQQSTARKAVFTFGSHLNFKQMDPKRLLNLAVSLWKA